MCHGFWKRSSICGKNYKKRDHDHAAHRRPLVKEGMGILLQKFKVETDTKNTGNVKTRYRAVMNERADLFLKTMDGKFRMINRDDLLTKLEGEHSDKPVVIDFRDGKAFEKSRIKNSLNIDIKKLSEEFKSMDKNRDIIAVCNGSVQSAYAIYYLYLSGFEKVYNLSGGFSGCLKNNYPLIEYFNEISSKN